MDKDRYIQDLIKEVEDLKATNLLLRKDNFNLTEALYGSYKRLKEVTDEQAEQL
tara:strand:+ start:393 stop:554 length:162 start_codon:yes stop_codon:yes gene_type:complete